MHKLSLQGLYVKILIEWVRDKERGAKREREDRKRVGRVGERRWRGGGGRGGSVFFPSPRALLFQKCLGLHSSTSAPLGLSAAS